MVEFSFILPCLNESKTIGLCIDKIKKVINENKLSAEIIVSDNGSTDGSKEIAMQKKVKLIHQPIRGYGAAYQKGIEKAKGKYLILGDADNTYDFYETTSFIKYLRNGYDFVMGSRLKGNIKKNAMPWHHRYIGNPLLSFLLRFLFKSNISDTHCGLRGITKKSAIDMKLTTTGMEFASEMVIKASKMNLKTKEIPITYYRRHTLSKLHSFKDGWRHLRFMLLFSPFYTFILPGSILFIIGSYLMMLFASGPLNFGTITLDIHPLLLGSLLSIVGLQAVIFGFESKLFTMKVLHDRDDYIRKIFSYSLLEKGLWIGILFLVCGLLYNIFILYTWVKSGFGFLNLRYAIISTTSIILGLLIIFNSFFSGVLMYIRDDDK